MAARCKIPGCSRPANISGRKATALKLCVECKHEIVLVDGTEQRFCYSQERKRERLKRKTAELTTAERNLVCILSNQAGTTLQPADVAMLHGIEEKEEAKLDAEEAQLAVEEASLAASSLPVGPLREAAEEVLHARRRALDAERGVLEAETEEEKRAAQVQGRDAADYEQAAKQLRAVVRRKHSL